MVGSNLQFTEYQDETLPEVNLNDDDLSNDEEAPPKEASERQIFEIRQSPPI